MKDRTTEKETLKRLIKLALGCEDYLQFEKKILSSPRWYLRSEGTKRWTKETLQRFFNLKNQMTSLIHNPEEVYRCL